MFADLLVALCRGISLQGNSETRGGGLALAGNPEDALINLCFLLSSGCVLISLLLTLFKKSWKHKIAHITLVLGFVTLLCLGAVGALGYHINKADSWNLDFNKIFAKGLNQATPLAALPETIPAEAKYLVEESERQERPILFKDISYEMDLDKAEYLMHTADCLVVGMPRHWFLLPISQTIHTIHDESLKDVANEIVPSDFEHYLTLIEADSGRHDILQDNEDLDYHTQKRLQLYLQWRFPRQTIGIIYHQGWISYVSHSPHKIIIKFNRPFVFGTYVEGSPLDFFELDTLWYQRPYDIYALPPVFTGIADQIRYGHRFLGNRYEEYRNALKILFYDEGAYGTMPKDPYFLFENGEFPQAEQSLDRLPLKRQAFMSNKLDQ